MTVENETNVSMSVFISMPANDKKNKMWEFQFEKWSKKSISTLYNTLCNG